MEESRDMKGMLLADDVFCCEEALENPMKTVQKKSEKAKDCLDRLRVTGAPVRNEGKVEVKLTIEDLKSELEEIKEIIVQVFSTWV